VTALDFLTELISGPLSFPAWGIAGSILVTIGCVIPSLPYRGRAKERYSPLNHFISELGELNVSVLAPLFNACLVVSGVLFAVFMVGFGRYLGTFAAVLAAAAGVYTSLACSMVGLFPMNRMSWHMISAMSFFYGGLATIILFGTASVLDPRELLPPAFAVFAALVVLAFAAFLLLPQLGGKNFSLDPAVSTRPRLWMHPLLEWLAMLGITGWILSVSLFILISGT
jgi:hypothetical membrane protein